jgi:hypothetical protein
MGQQTRKTHNVCEIVETGEQTDSECDQRQYDGEREVHLGPSFLQMPSQDA